MTDKASISSKDDPRMATTRLAAVQAVYELDMMDVAVDDVLADFTEDRWRAADEDIVDEMARPRPELLKTLILGVNERRADIDAQLIPALTGAHTLNELEALLRAILRTAGYELMVRDNVPARTVISAYMALGDAFYDDGGQIKLIGGILNAIARTLRPAEFKAAS